MAELTYKWWIANKAKTLTDEPLSGALKSIEPDQEKMKKAPRRAENVKSLLDKLPKVLKAIEDTLGLCKPKIHDTTKTNLEALKGQATSLFSELDGEFKGYENTMKEVTASRSTISKCAKEAVTKPSAQTLDQVIDGCKKLEQCLTKAPLRNEAKFQEWDSQCGRIKKACEKLKGVLANEPKTTGNKPLPSVERAVALKELKNQLALAHL